MISYKAMGVQMNPDAYLPISSVSFPCLGDLLDGSKLINTNRKTRIILTNDLGKENELTYPIIIGDELIFYEATDDEISETVVLKVKLQMIKDIIDTIDGLRDKNCFTPVQFGPINYQYKKLYYKIFAFYNFFDNCLSFRTDTFFNNMPTPVEGP